MGRSRGGWIAFGAVVAVLGAGTGLSQNQALAGAQTTLQVYSRLTVVDVTVTDASGRPVQGLQRSDFTVLEDGKPQSLRNFEEITAGYVPPPPQLPPNVYTNLRPKSASPAVNILLLDFANEAPVDSTRFGQVGQSTQMQHYVKQAALDAIDRMPVGTEIAIVSMTNSLHILQSFTSDPAILKAAVNAAPYFLEGHGDVQCVQSNERNNSVLEAFDQIAADTAAMKIRKSLIWFTVGVPAITLPNERPECLPDYTAGLTKAYDALRASDVAVYPIYANGVGYSGDALLSMEAVAEATGGIAYAGSNDMAIEVDKALDNGSNYYSMAYVPPSAKYDGAYHKISVKVDRPGVTLVFRKGYYADDLAKAEMKPGLTMTMTPPPAKSGNMKAAMSRGLPTSQQILFDVQVLPTPGQPKPGDDQVLGTLDAKLKGKRLVRYALQYSVPAQQIDFKAAVKGVHKGALEFDVAVYDANDKLLTGLSQTLKMPASDAVYQKLMKGSLPFAQQIDIPATQGPLFMRIGVLDVDSDKVGTLEIPLTVPKK